MPRPELIVGATSAAGTADGRCIVAYVVDRDQVSVDAAQLAGPTVARWFDPASGTIKPAPESPLDAAGMHELSVPAANADGHGDWVLLLENRP